MMKFEAAINSSIFEKHTIKQDLFNIIPKALSASTMFCTNFSLHLALKIYRYINSVCQVEKQIYQLLMIVELIRSTDITIPKTIM